MTKSLSKNVFGNDSDILSIDILELYTKFITEIDKYRSNFAPLNSSYVNKGNLSANNVNKALANSDMNVNPQESRVNAFFRLVGFPIINQKNEMFNGGYDKTLTADDINKNYNIANGLSQEIFNYLNTRELLPKNNAMIFFSQNINSIAYAFTMGRDPFIFDKLDGEPLDTKKVVYTEKNRDILISTFIDENNNKANVKVMAQHILKPFIIDPRIDFTVTPAKNRICAPFLTDVGDTYLDPSTPLQRPFIEKIITIRCSNSASQVNEIKSKSAYITSILDFIKTDSSVDQQQINDFDNELNVLTEIELKYFNRYIKLIAVVVDELFENVQNIRNVSSAIDFAPIPDTRGPEFGSTLRKVQFTNAVNKLIEKNIISLTYTKLKEELLNDTANTTDNLSTNNNFALNGLNDVIFGQFMTTQSTNPTKNSTDKQLTNLNNKRNKAGNLAIDSLKKIEIITGEISGIGLLDILAILATFWIMDKEFLVDMMDERCFARLVENDELKVDEVESRRNSNRAVHPPLECLAEFEKKLKDILKLINTFYIGKFSNK